MADSRTAPSIGTEIIASLREFADVLKSKHDVSRKYTCRMVASDIPRVPYTAERVKETRRLLGTSQTVLAMFLGVSVKTVRAWEQGVNTPSGLAARFLDEIRRDPAYWVKRLEETLVTKSDA